MWSSSVMRNLYAFFFLPLLGGSLDLHPVLNGPDMAYLGSEVVFQCMAPDSFLPVTYELRRDGLLIDMREHHHEKRPAFFSQKATAHSEGLYNCEAKTEGITQVSNSIRLSVVIPPRHTRITTDPFPAILYEGSRLVLNCEVASGSHLSYTWFFNRMQITSFTSQQLHVTGNKLVIERVTPKHAGYYSCMAWSRVRDVQSISSSSEVKVAVKAYLLKPEISLSIFKEGTSYRGNVTCWSSRGTPPVNFSLLLDDKVVASVLTSDSASAWFSIDVVPGLDMGVVRCCVNSEVQQLMSEPLTLEVVPVGGDVNVEVEYLYSSNSKPAAARLTCHISRGSFPLISWLHNDSTLLSETQMSLQIQNIWPQYALIDWKRTLILAKLRHEESGYYRCRARDSYDESAAWLESGAVLIQVKDWMIDNKPQEAVSSATSATTTEIIAIIFCCFLLVTLAVSSYCVYMMIGHKKARRLSSSPNASSDRLPFSVPVLPLEAKQGDACLTDCGINIQMMEITV
ncbi:Fc receptor-like protein 5 isoform X2 [Corythoichthys intestinalis]|uniref:Fc receptor-like protein 5 isoform X2 n=1 Tax=Corythoichthys intestinalis TaxID=161448 RepID=UPI0025A5C8EA|nr:Fc receptor-like protein 5 isoform X2 [Corythoichthys intestinalis]